MMGGAMAARYRALVKYVRHWGPNIVHGQGSERECALVAIRSGLPNIITLHGNFREISKVFNAQPFSYYWWAAKMETVALEQTNGLICISRYVEEITRPFPTKKFIIPNAIEKKYLNAGPCPQRITDKRRVCCMGTIDQRKQTRKIVEACEILWGRGMDFVLDVYGSPGRGQSYFEEFTQALLPWVKKNMAHYHGYTTDPVEAIRSSDVMVSASCEESFGMNILEAMALGVPVVAPEVGGIRDILINGQTGFFYPLGDIEACAAKIEQLLFDENLRKNFSAQGIKRARECFSPERIAEMTVQAYRQIAG
jgi:glycosyltransferase involved in cell wall biosynthesis